MTDKTEKLSAKLAAVRKNAEDARRLIAYHRKMLKTYLRKETELTERLEKAQLNDLFKAVKDKGCDISAINDAINKGEFGKENADEADIIESAEDNAENNGDNIRKGERDHNSNHKEDK